MLGLPQQEVGHVRAGGFADFQAWGQRGQHLVSARKWAIRKHARPPAFPCSLLAANKSLFQPNLNRSIVP
jgi:hypothetical protein